MWYLVESKRTLCCNQCGLYLFVCIFLFLFFLLFFVLVCLFVLVKYVAFLDIPDIILNLLLTCTYISYIIHIYIWYKTCMFSICLTRLLHFLKVKRDIVSWLGDRYIRIGEFKPLLYRSQVVAGTNYLVKVKTTCISPKK